MLSPLTWGVQHEVDFPAVSTGVSGDSAREDPSSRRHRFCTANTQKQFIQVLHSLKGYTMVQPQYHIAPTFHIEWNRFDPGLDPSSGGLGGVRAQRKRWQVENLAGLVATLIRPGSVVVEFCAGSGFVALPLASLFPRCTFVLVDMKRRSLDIAKTRIQLAKLRNVEVVHGRVEHFDRPFDVGIALHACGEASDLSMERCLSCGAAFVICPCCVGKVKLSSLLQYPRSAALRSVLSGTEYASVARAADSSVRNVAGASLLERKRRLCKSFVERDRNLRAEEVGYKTFMFVLQPASASPKNDVLVGIPPAFDSTRVVAEASGSCGVRMHKNMFTDWKRWTPSDWIGISQKEDLEAFIETCVAGSEV